MSSINLVNETLKATPTQGEIEFNGQFHATDNNSSRAQMQRLVLEAAKTASGTSVEFTGIPPWVKRITVMFNGVSLSGTDSITIQLGTSGGYVTSGYTTGSTTTSGTTNITITTGFPVAANSAAADSYTGIISIVNITGNIWLENAAITQINSGSGRISAGVITLSGTLDRLRTIGTASSAFDSGTVNILYEG